MNFQEEVTPMLKKMLMANGSDNDRAARVSPHGVARAARAGDFSAETSHV
jgi:hypothetical protein